jgi:hypothetical protein
MKRPDVQAMSVDQLVEQFTAIALDQDRAITLDDSAKYNRLFDRMENIKELLKSREGDQRGALEPLLQHRNAQVRLKAAIALLAVEPEAARATLQAISDKSEYPQAADARGMMRALDEGRYVPS